MIGGFILLLGVLLLWVAFTRRGRAMFEAITGLHYSPPSS